MTNGVGKPGFRELEQRGWDGLPTPIRQFISDAPINLGAWGIYQKFLRLRATEQWEIEAYLKDLQVFVDNVMKSGHPSGTSYVWRVDTATRTFDTNTPHPQEAREYEWPDYQVYPRRHRTRVTEITLDKYK